METSNIDLIKKDKNNNNTVKDEEISLIDQRNLIEDLLEINSSNYLDVTKELCVRYPEIVWLTSKVHNTPEGVFDPKKKDQKISVQLYGESHVEYDKTVVSIFCLFWVCSNNYDAFVECQPPAARLTRENFQKLREYVFTYLGDGKKGDPKAIEALVVFTVLNDLGKVEAIVQLVRARTAVEEVDHDKILWMGLKTNPKLFPSYLKLSELYKKYLLEGLSAQFNFAQLVQAENVPASLIGLKGLGKESLHLFNLHALFDMAGAAAGFKWNGSVVLTDATYKDVMGTIAAMETIAQGATVTQVYDSYLHFRGHTLGLDVHKPTQRALLRICCLLRMHTKQEAEFVIRAYENFSKEHPEEWALLRKEMNMTGIDDGWAILLYYAPAVLVNCQSKTPKETGKTHSEIAVEYGMWALAQCFRISRPMVKDRTGNGVFTADIAEIAAQAAKEPKNLLKMKYIITPIGEDGKITGKFDDDFKF